jgi:signal transduction histidine kinase/ActR/RegA family two-component response regulator
MNALQTSEARIALILEIAEIGFWDFDLATHSCNWSAQAKHFFEMAPESPVTYKSFLAAVHRDDKDYVDREIMTVVKAGNGHYSIRFRGIGINSGDERFIVATGIVIHSSSQKVSKIIGVFCDVTDRHQHDIDLKTETLKAITANTVKSQFLSNVSHEFRTPLSAILGCAELASNRDYTADQRGDFIGTIRRNGKNLMGMIDNLLDLSDVEKNKMAIRLEPFLLKETLQEVVSSYHSKAEQKGLSVLLTSRGQIPQTVHSDLLRFQQILGNLLNNAIKFTNKGTVEIIVEIVSPLKEGHRMTLRIAVHDSGIGIPDEERTKLFGRFCQLDSSSTRKFGGAGIGLDLSKRIALALGGDLILEESTPGTGSTFVFLFPDSVMSKETKFTYLTKQEVPNISTFDSVQTNSDLSGIRVLVVDDCEDIQAMLGHFLTSVGAEVDFAADGFEAIEKAQTEFHHIVLMDIQMPGLDGISATERLRDGGYKKPIIAVTSNSKIEDIRKSMRSGFNDHLTKPINFKDLLQEVARWVGKDPKQIAH